MSKLTDAARNDIKNIPKDQALFFLKLIQEKKFDPKRLTIHQRRICVRLLLDEGKYTQREIATILGSHPEQITRDKKYIYEQDRWVLGDLTEADFAINAIKKAELFSARLVKKGEEKEAWDIERELIEVLQSLGFLKKKPIEFEGTLTLQEILTLAAKIETTETLTAKIETTKNGNTVASQEEKSVLGRTGDRTEEYSSNGSS